MINPIFNREERRFRAGIRIPFFFIGMIVLVGLIQSIPLAGWEWIIIIPIAFGWYRLNLFLTDHRIAKDSPWYSGGLYWSSTSLKHYLAGWLIGLIALSSMVGLGWLLGFFSVDLAGYVSNEFTRSSNTWHYSVFLLLIQMLAVGFYEEVMLRGYVLINFKEGLSCNSISHKKALYMSIILSSLVFSLAHLFNPNASIITFVTISLAGILLAFPFIWTGNLALSIGLHSAWNFILGGVYGFKVSGLSWEASIVSVHSTGPEWWTGGLFGPEAGLSGVFAMCLSLLLIFIFLQRSMAKQSIHILWLNPAKRDELF